MKHMLLPVVLSAIVGVGGCIPSSQLAEGELDNYWLLSEDPTPRTRYSQPRIGERKFPAHWIVRRASDVAAATESINRASDLMKQGVEKIDFSVSVEHAEMLVGLVDRIREMLGNLGRLVDADSDSDRTEWAQLMAGALVQAEYITRSVEGWGQGDGGAESLGTSVWPLVKMLTVYLHEHSGGALLGELGPDEVDRIRTVLTQMTLRLGFDLTGKQLPPGLRREVTDLMRRTKRLGEMERALAKLLAERVGRAPVAPHEAKARKQARVASAWGPKALQVMQAFMKQWDRMDRIELELRRDGDRPVIVGMVKVLPGKEVRIADVMIFQPTMIFRGASRIVLIPEAPGTGERVLMYQAIGDDGAVELRFEGMAYGLVRLLAIPLANGRLREVRVFTKTPKWGDQIVNVAIFTEAIGDKGDPRRLLVFQDVRRKRMVREAFSVRGIKEEEKQVFNYLTPTRRYTYHRLAKQPSR